MTDTTQTTVTPDQDTLDAIPVTLNLTVKDVNAILAVLGNAPFVASAGLIQLIQSQGAPQVQAAVQAAAPADDSTPAS
jgi:hypothetical protein